MSFNKIDSIFSLNPTIYSLWIYFDYVLVLLILVLIAWTMVLICVYVLVCVRQSIILTNLHTGILTICQASQKINTVKRNSCPKPTSEC